MKYHGKIYKGNKIIEDDKFIGWLYRGVEIEVDESRRGYWGCYSARFPKYGRKYFTTLQEAKRAVDLLVTDELYKEFQDV